VEAFLDGDDLVLRNAHASLRYHLLRGSYDVLDEVGAPVVLNAIGVAQSGVILPREVWRSSDPYESDWAAREVDTRLGHGVEVTVLRALPPFSPPLRQVFTMLDGLGLVLATLDVANDGRSPLRVGALHPLSTDAADAAVLIGEDRDLRLLTNGALNYLDFAEPIVPGTDGIVSNWSALLYNQATGRSLSLGFLSFAVAQPVIYSGPAAGISGAQTVIAAAQYDPGKDLAPGANLTSETMLLDFTGETPHAALETWADRVKAWLDIRLWTERHPDFGVPAGWNSWSGSGGSGGYGTNIDEAVLVDNMDFADRELRRWGMNHFQVDDGWQDHIGDWVPRADRFPDHGNQNGIAWLMTRARSLGFRTGLWMDAFHAAGDARIFADHPEWFVTPLTGDEHVLDLSNPEVLAHFDALMAEVKGWGLQWLKLDFGYRAMLTKGWADPTLTRIEFYRRGVERLRAALGDDVFLLNVAIVGPNLGLIDSSRLTLDTMPAWEGESEDPYGPLGEFDNQGLKPMYRASARRYYLDGRVWINHPDLIFFRAHSDPRIPPLTLSESRTFATAVALQGGLVKLGDKLIDLSSDAVDSLRRILPPVGLHGRPLDLLRREFPEVWSVPVPSFGEPYHVIGLLNWGLNRDLTQLPYAWIDDAPREIRVSLADAGLDRATRYLAFEFWEQEFLGEAQGFLAVDVPARTPRVVALRPKLDRPQYLGTNRHVLGGFGVVRSVVWDAGENTLNGVQEGSVGTDHAPFVHRVTLYVPAGYAPADADVTAPTGYAIEGKTLDAGALPVATLSFAVRELPGACSPGTVCVHPDVTWRVRFDRSRQAR
jgi:hypothetical protein